LGETESATVMDIYKRKITTTLWALRLSFVTAVLLSIYLMQSSFSDYGFVLLFLLICGAIFPVTDLKISQGHFKVRQYYVYGIFCRKWKFDKTDKVKLEPADLVIGDVGVSYTDDWYDIFLIAVPVKKITIKKYVLKYYKSSSSLKRIKLTLSTEEIDALKKSFILDPMPITEDS
jgi:hypothetical protein